MVRLGAELDVPFSGDIPSALHYTVQKDDVDMSLLLLACGASPHVCDAYNSYSMLKVVKSREIAEALITMGADVNKRSSVGWTNLHTTPVRDHVEVLRTLVANGANPRARDGDAKTTPRNSAFISDASERFLCLAEKGIKLYKAQKDGEALPLGISAFDLHVLQRLESVLDPLVLTEDKQAKIRDDLYMRSILHDTHVAELKQRAVTNFLLCARRRRPTWSWRSWSWSAPSSVPGTLPALPAHVLKIIANHCYEDCWSPINQEGCGKALIEAFDYFDHTSCDWSIPSDACTENDFAGHNDFDLSGFEDGTEDGSEQETVEFEDGT